MKRIYAPLLLEHFKRYQQMVFLIGPRQVGKTTLSLMAREWTDRFTYLNWDDFEHRKMIVEGSRRVADFAGLNELSTRIPIIVFDEIHKYGKWKIFLKGFFDTWKGKVHILVTGSSRLDVYKRGGDSLMGRYFPYRLHPFSLGELKQRRLSGKEVNTAFQVTPREFEKLLHNGGFPEPFLKDDQRFLNRWKALRIQQLIREDIRDLSRIQELTQMELLAEILRHQAGQLANYSTLANKVQVSVDTIRRWLKTLQSFFYCFSLQPWSKNIPRSLLKEPKIYLWDWINVESEGGRLENFVASHLLKAVHFWTDRGMGRYELWFIRDKEKREVDFLVTRDGKPWFLVEVKTGSKAGLNKHLGYFQKKTGARHAFQIVFDKATLLQDCFQYFEPVLVPAQTFLSQLV